MRLHKEDLDSKIAVMNFANAFHAGGGVTYGSSAQEECLCRTSKGADSLVLGAFGCGAFRNNPKVVANAYKVALDVFPKVFKRIEFAVYCSPSDERNYQEFKKVFG